MFQRSSKSLRRGFSGWRRAVRKEAVLSLEAKLVELEELFVASTCQDGDRGAAWEELAELEDEASSDSAVDSDWDSDSYSQSVASNSESRESRASRRSRASLS